MLVQKSLKLFLVILFLVIPCFGSDVCSKPDSHKWRLAEGLDVAPAQRARWFALAEVQDGTFADKCLELLSDYPQLLNTPDPARGDRHLIHLCIDNHNIDGVTTLLGRGVSPNTEITGNSGGVVYHLPYGGAGTSGNLLTWAINAYLESNSDNKEACKKIVLLLFDSGGRLNSHYLLEQIDDSLLRIFLDKIDIANPCCCLRDKTFLQICLRQNLLDRIRAIKNVFENADVAYYMLPYVVSEKNDDPAFVQQVLSVAHDVNAIGFSDHTALREACKHNNIDLFRQLIDQGAAVFIYNTSRINSDIFNLILADECNEGFAQFFLVSFGRVKKELMRRQHNEDILLNFLNRAYRRNNWLPDGAKLKLAEKLFCISSRTDVLDLFHRPISGSESIVGEKAFAHECCRVGSDQGLKLLSSLEIGKCLTYQDQHLLVSCISRYDDPATAVARDICVGLLLNLGCELSPPSPKLIHSIATLICSNEARAKDFLRICIVHGFNINAPDCRGELFWICFLDTVCINFNSQPHKKESVVRFINNLIRESIIDPFARSSSSSSVLLCAMKKYEEALLDFDQIKDVINACKTFAQTSEVNKTAMNAQMHEAFDKHHQKMLEAWPQGATLTSELPQRFNQLHTTFVRLLGENIFPLNREYAQTLPEIMRLKNMSTYQLGWMIACVKARNARGLQAPPGTVVGAQAAAPVLVPQLAPSSAQVSQPAAETDSEGAVAASRQLVGAAPSSASASEEVTVLTEESVPAKPKQKWNMHAKKIAGGGTVLALGSLAYLVAELSKNRENRALVRWFFKKLRGKKVAPLTSQQRKSAGRLKIDAAVAIPGVVLGAAAVVAARNIKTP